MEAVEGHWELRIGDGGPACSIPSAGTGKAAIQGLVNRLFGPRAFERKLLIYAPVAEREDLFQIVAIRFIHFTSDPLEN